MHFPPAIFDLWEPVSTKGRSLLLYFYARADLDGKCWPSLTKICKDTGMHKNTVIRCIRELEIYNFISRTMSNGVRTIYQILPVSKDEPVIKRVPPPVTNLLPVIKEAPVTKLVPNRLQNEYRTGYKTSTLTVQEQLQEQQHKSAAVLSKFGFDDLTVTSLLNEPWANRENLLSYVNSKISLIGKRKVENPAGALIEALRKNWVDFKAREEAKKTQRNKQIRAERERYQTKILEKFQLGEFLTNSEYEEISKKLPVDCDVIWETAEDGYKVKLNI